MEVRDLPVNNRGEEKGLTVGHLKELRRVGN
jgi:hypothetical protein